MVGPIGNNRSMVMEVSKNMSGPTRSILGIDGCGYSPSHVPRASKDHCGTASHKLRV